MSKVLRETIPILTGVSLPGFSAENALAADPRIDETERRKIAIIAGILMGSSMQ